MDLWVGSDIIKLQEGNSLIIISPIMIIYILIEPWFKHTDLSFHADTSIEVQLLSQQH
jgi:hypothetical protein